MPRGRGRRRTLSQGLNSRTNSRSGRGRSGSSSDSRASRPALRRSVRIMNLGTTREEPDPPQETSSPARLRNIQQLQQSISEHTNPPTSEQIHQQVDRHQWIPEVETTRFIDAETNEPLRDLTPPLNDVNNRANNMFDMDIVVEPAGNVRPGNVLHPPVVIELKHRSGLDNADSRHHNYDHLWALASILSDQGTTALAPPRADLLLGTPVSSIHTAVQSESNTEIGYVSFSDLAIQQPGQYRLRVSLIRMEGLGGSTASSLQGGANLQSIVSRVIHVDEAAIAPSISTGDQEILDDLSRRGMHVARRVT